MASPAPSAPPLPCSERHGVRGSLRGYGVRDGLPDTGGKIGARRRHPARLVSISSLSLSLSLSCAGQQRPCSRRSRQPWRAGPGTRGGRGPSLSARTGGRREAQRGDQTGRAPYHAASAPASSMQGLLFRNSLANPSKFAFTSSPALSA